MRSVDRAKLRAGSAKRGAALGFLIIAGVLLAGAGMVQCARYMGSTEQSATATKAKPGAVKTAPKKAPKKGPAAAAPNGAADGLFRGHSPN